MPIQPLIRKEPSHPPGDGRAGLPPLPDDGPSRHPEIGFLLDMDGVIYKGDEPIPGAQDFIRDLQAHEIPFLFLTNNSASTPRDYVDKLSKMGMDLSEDHFYTCAMATVEFLSQQKPGGTAYVIGEGGLLTALHGAGFAITAKDPDYVIVGEGRVLNYEMAEKALNMIRRGAHLIATNTDITCPVPAGIRPGCGALVALLETASQRPAYSVGKPSPFMMRAARKRIGRSTAETVMVGDTMATDIRGAVELGFYSVLVLTGGTRPEELSDFAFRPRMILDSIADLSVEALREEILARLLI